MKLELALETSLNEVVVVENPHLVLLETVTQLRDLHVYRNNQLLNIINEHVIEAGIEVPILEAPSAKKSLGSKYMDFSTIVMLWETKLSNLVGRGIVLSVLKSIDAIQTAGKADAVKLQSIPFEPLLQLNEQYASMIRSLSFGKDNITTAILENEGKIKKAIGKLNKKATELNNPRVYNTMVFSIDAFYNYSVNKAMSKGNAITNKKFTPSEAVALLLKDGVNRNMTPDKYKKMLDKYTKSLDKRKANSTELKAQASRLNAGVKEFKEIALASEQKAKTAEGNSKVLYTSYSVAIQEFSLVIAEMAQAYVAFLTEFAKAEGNIIKENDKVLKEALKK